MRIKFKAPDPRAGTVAQMDSHRGQQLIDCGAAVAVKEGADDSVETTAESPTPVTTTPPKAAKKAAKKSAAKAS